MLGLSTEALNSDSVCVLHAWFGNSVFRLAYEALCRCVQPGDRPGSDVMKEKESWIFLSFCAGVIVVYTRLVPARDRFDVGVLLLRSETDRESRDGFVGEPLARDPHRVGLYLLMRTC